MTDKEEVTVKSWVSCAHMYNAQVECNLPNVGHIKFPVNNAHPSCMGSMQEECEKGGKSTVGSSFPPAPSGCSCTDLQGVGRGMQEKKIQKMLYMCIMRTQFKQ